jgi:hypothetical protein
MGRKRRRASQEYVFQILGRDLVCEIVVSRVWIHVFRSW